MSDKKETLFVSFSGGRTSAYMCWWLLKNKADKYNFIFLFANTGQEHENTLKFVDQCDKAFGLNLVWLEAVVNPEKGKGTGHKVVSYSDAATSGEPYLEVCKKYGIANADYPHCTRELKIAPMEHYMASIGFSRDYKRCVGIRSDEIDRMDINAIESGKIIYPLIKWKPTTKAEIRHWWAEQDFDLEVDEHYGNCFSGDTLFLSESGPKRLDESVGLTRVLTRSGWVDAEVNRFGSQEVKILTIKNGPRTKEIRVTDDHKWFVSKYKNGNRKVQQVKRTCELSSGDMIFNCFDDLSDVSIIDEGVVHGFTFGDGSLEGKSCRTYIDPCKADISQYFDRGGYKKVSRNRRSGIPGSYKSLKGWESWSRNYKASFLSGLIASDGCVSSVVSITNKDSSYIVEISNMCKSLGINGSVKLDMRRDTNYKKGAFLSRLTISNKCIPDKMVLRAKHLMSRSKARTNPKMWSVVSVGGGDVMDVYCATVLSGPSEFTLDDGILTHNCVTCWKKSDRKLYTIAKNELHRFDFFNQLESECGHITTTEKPRKLFRRERGCQDIIASSNNPFKEFVDHMPELQYRLDIDELDIEDSCGASCEAH